MRVAVVVGAVSAAMFASAAGAALLVLRTTTRRLVVDGTSMEPTLSPGDRLLVLRLPAPWPLRRGDLVAVPDPRTAQRLLVKRVGSLGSGTVSVLGDNEAASTDSRDFGPLARAAVFGRVVYRYAPRQRAGRLSEMRHGRHGRHGRLPGMRHGAQPRR
jgi:nickel-type superoxide dismutase maturation protease